MLLLLHVRIYFEVLPNDVTFIPGFVKIDGLAEQTAVYEVS